MTKQMPDRNYVVALDVAQEWIDYIRDAHGGNVALIIVETPMTRRTSVGGATFYAAADFIIDVRGDIARVIKNRDGETTAQRPIPKPTALAEKDQAGTSELSSLLRQAAEKTSRYGRLLLQRGPRGDRCYVDCPAVGYRREVGSIKYLDGGVLEFPHDFSGSGDRAQAERALPASADGVIPKPTVLTDLQEDATAFRRQFETAVDAGIESANDLIREQSRPFYEDIHRNVEKTAEAVAKIEASIPPKPTPPPPREWALNEMHRSLGPKRICAGWFGIAMVELLHEDRLGGRFWKRAPWGTTIEPTIGKR